jgi:hypothetical protein
VRSLHNVHEMNAYRADHVCLPGRILMKFGMDFMLLASTLKQYFSNSNSYNW